MNQIGNLMKLVPFKSTDQTNVKWRTVDDALPDVHVASVLFYWYNASPGQKKILEASLISLISNP